MDNRNPEMIEAAKRELMRRQAASAELQRRSMGNQPSENGLTDQLKNIPGYVAGAAIGLPGKIMDFASQIPGAAKRIATHPIEAAQDLAGGLARGSQRLASGLLEGGEFLTRKGAEHLGKSLGHPVNVPYWNAREFMGLEGKNKIDLGKYLESNNPNALLSTLGQYGLGGAAGGVRALPFIGANALNAGIQADPENRVQGAIEGGVGAALPIGVMKGANALRPSRLFGGNISTEEMQANMRAAEGTETGLGDIIGSPFLKRQYENFLTKLPLSGATQKLQRTGQQVIDKGNTILEDMGQGVSPESANARVYDALNESFEHHQNKKNAFYKNFEKEADKQFLDLPLRNFSTMARENLAALEDTNLLKYDPAISSIMKKLGIYANPVEKIPGNMSPVSQFGETMLGEPLTTFKYPTAKEANLLKGSLNKIANTLKASPVPSDRFKAGIFSDLSKAIKKDMTEAIEKSGNEKLMQAWKEADKNYAENFSGFLDKDIYKFIGGSADPDIIVSHFLKMSKTSDRSNFLSKLIDRLPENEKNMVAYSYFSRALDNEGSLNPSKLANLVGKLGKNQFETLVPDSTLRQQLKDYKRLYGMNTKATHMMYNAETGQKALDIIPAALLESGMNGNVGMMGKMAGAIGNALIPGAVNRPIVNWMTSPKSREAMVKAIIKNKRK